ncbi:hypothetical protein BYT27DRAFT_7333124 [Phlegmacium glaucopus]|nr:hypothetical protein BYT27DRAFT_7333124 [Phlegmacium glaucopus]
MAAVYLHNALYAPDPQEAEISFVHSRNLSTFSNATFLTSTTIHSQPTEPLLHTMSPRTPNYEDQLDHIPRNRAETIGRLPYEDPLMIDDNPVSEAEQKGYWARNFRKPLKRWKWIKLGLQTSLAVWAIYNTVRYIMAFTVFSDSTNQSFCLALGTSTGASFLLACISFLAIRDNNGIVQGVTHSYLSYVRLILDSLSSFLLLGPAVVNFALIFIWKDPIDPHFNLDNRCHLDIDVVWSVSNTLCSNESPPWAIWLILSTFRLALTLIIIIGYHITSSLYHGSRRRRAIRGFRARASEPPTHETPVPSSLNLLPHQELGMVHQLSDSTLCGTVRGEPSPQNQIRLARSNSSNLSRRVSPTEPVTLGRSTITESENDGFVDHFQLMVSQIAQETDEALDLARSVRSPSPESISDMPIRDLPPSYQEDPDGFNDTHVGLSHSNANNVFNLPPIRPTLGYDEFGLPYPPDQNVRVLNGYIRRMPTIESMGSGEVGSSACASSNHAGESNCTSSRPPTRNTRLSWNSTDHDASSESPSRTNSLSARAELLAGLSSIASTTSEHGELLGRTSPLARRSSTPTSYVDHALSIESYSSATSGSRATSYHTAMSESFLPPGLTLDTPSRSPDLEQDTISDWEQPP